MRTLNADATTKPRTGRVAGPVGTCGPNSSAGGVGARGAVRPAGGHTAPSLDTSPERHHLEPYVTSEHAGISLCAGVGALDKGVELSPGRHRRARGERPVGRAGHGQPAFRGGEPRQHRPDQLRAGRCLLPEPSQADRRLAVPGNQQPRAPARLDDPRSGLWRNVVQEAAPEARGCRAGQTVMKTKAIRSAVKRRSSRRCCFAVFAWYSC